MNTPALYVGDIPFYDTPAEVEGSPYWVDHWADINGYKIGLQIKPQSYQSASISIYMGKAKLFCLSLLAVSSAPLLAPVYISYIYTDNSFQTC